MTHTSPTSLTHEGEELLSPSLPYDIGPRVERAVADDRLQQSIGTATENRDAKRKQAMVEAFGEQTDAVRDLAGRIKQHTLDNLDYYLETFIDQAQAVGAHVHLANDADQANAIATEIVRSRGAKTCVKSKSMVTEEIGLVPALGAIGCETVETDLGEFILQLDNDAPSHIVTPMIHKHRRAAARAFQRELGVAYTEDAEQLTMIARDYLRRKYREADVGISGANFAIAETGSLVLCTNEGNGRFCTSTPDTHIAFVGIEKLIPNLEHLSVMLKVLARSSTGQPLTVYTHTMTGPRRLDEPDGPSELHIVLVDNGRSEVLKPDTREMLRCIRCGACLNACPVYRKIGGHAYGSVYSGPIGAILTPVLKGTANYPDLPYASSLCGACYEACPVKINIPKHLIKLRQQLVEKKTEKLVDRLFMRVWTVALLGPLRYRLGSWLNRQLLRLEARRQGHMEADERPYQNHRFVEKGVGPMKGWTAIRDLPTTPAKSFHQWWRHRTSRHRSR